MFGHQGTPGAVGEAVRFAAKRKEGYVEQPPLRASYREHGGHYTAGKEAYVTTSWVAIT